MFHDGISLTGSGDEHNNLVVKKKIHVNVMPANDAHQHLQVWTIVGAYTCPGKEIPLSVPIYLIDRV